MFSERIRRYGFWTLDFFKGRKIYKEYIDIKRIMNLSKADLQNIQDDYIKELIHHAIDTTTYYKKRIHKDDDFSNIPVINKNIIKSHYLELQSDIYRDAKKHYMTTSGSTGTPFTMVQDMKKRRRVLADLIYFNELCDNPIGTKFIFFRVWTSQNKNSRLQQFAKNMIPINILYFTQENFEQIRQLLIKNRKIKTTLAYASTYEHLCKYIKKCGDASDKYHLHTVISGSEILEPEVKGMIADVFGCNVVSRYANEENGLIAQQCLDHDEFHINSASYKVEILSMNSDEPVHDGEVGRVVVTDLFNYAMPLLRYDTGDLAVKCDKAECGWGGEVLKNIQGRKVDVIYDTKGNPLTPHTWSVYMWKFNKLSQYQFIQEGQKDYVLKVNDSEQVYKDEEFVNCLIEVLGEDANISVVRVNEIPTLESGKFKKTVCNYQK